MKSMSMNDFRGSPTQHNFNESHNQHFGVKSDFPPRNNQTGIEKEVK